MCCKTYFTELFFLTTIISGLFFPIFVMPVKTTAKQIFCPIKKSIDPSEEPMPFS